MFVPQRELIYTNIKETRNSGFLIGFLRNLILTHDISMNYKFKRYFKKTYT